MIFYNENDSKDMLKLKEKALEDRLNFLNTLVRPKNNYDEEKKEDEDIIDFGDEPIEESEESIQRARKAEEELNKMFGITIPEPSDPIIPSSSKNELPSIPEEPIQKPYRSISLAPPPTPRSPKQKIDSQSSREAMSYVERLGSRLRNIQASSQTMPVRVINEMNKISEKANFCAGLSS